MIPITRVTDMRTVALEADRLEEAVEVLRRAGHHVTL
jgi:hypothetical protein